MFYKKSKLLSILPVCL